jgi:hypothetical protein
MAGLRDDNQFGLRRILSQQFSLPGWYDAILVAGNDQGGRLQARQMRAQVSLTDQLEITVKRGQRAAGKIGLGLF